MLNRSNILRSSPFLFLWIGGFILFYKANRVFDYAALSRPVNHASSLAYGLPRLTGEVLLLYLILRPNSFCWSWWRVLLAIATFVPWFVYSIGYIMHAPEWVFVHVNLLLAIMLMLGILFVVSCLGAFIKWHNKKSA